MNLTTFHQPALRRIKEHPVLSGVLVIAIIAATSLFFVVSREPVGSYSFYEARRGDFLISVVEGGTLEAVNEVVIRSEVEGTARIIYIVPEGSYVKKGSLVVELDSSSTQDAVNQQQINVEKAEFYVLQAEQQLDIQKSVVDSEVAAARLRLEFAESDLEKFLKGEAQQLQRNAEIEITNVIENLQIAIERLQWSERLYTNGFETKGNLDRDRLTVSQTGLKLEQTRKALWMVETFDVPKRKRSLEAALQEAKENFDRVKLQGDRKLAQFAADLESQTRTLELSTAKLDRDKAQLAATKLYAPQDGMVVYASGGRFSNESMIEEGAIVRNRQELIKLPDVSLMKVQVKIHESHINQIRRGQPAYVVLDSLPDRRFLGLVNKVAPLPDGQSRWGNPDLKVYATEIVITDGLPDLKPGVSARAEVVITNLPNALTVPIQAVTTRQGKQVVFLASNPNAPVPVSVGMYNTKLIEITSGIRDGDQVLLAPPMDLKEKDLGGAIIANGESLPAPTNALSALPLPRNEEQPAGRQAFADIAEMTRTNNALLQSMGMDRERLGSETRARRESSARLRTNQSGRLRPSETTAASQSNDAGLAAVETEPGANIQPARTATH
jgi:HlyD family secretion protein